MAEASAPKLPVATGVLAEDIYVAGVEGGGTSWKVALGKVSPDLRSCKVIEWLEVPTHKPEETLPVINRWLKERQAQFNFVGIGSFGPVQPKRNKPNYGHITATPKVEWKFTDVVGPIMDGLVVPGGAPMPHQFDTDVNAPALGEFLLDGLREEGKSSLAYITVGTGIGVGTCASALLQGLLPVRTKPCSTTLHPITQKLHRVRVASRSRRVASRRVASHGMASHRITDCAQLTRICPRALSTP